MGCQRVNQSLYEVKPSINKDMPGQKLLLLNTLLNFLVLGTFLFLSSWCFLHQETLVGWLVITTEAL